MRGIPVAKSAAIATPMERADVDLPPVDFTQFIFAFSLTAATAGNMLANFMFVTRL
jgi:hypothetical protein